jgi:hypothetical protein
MPSVDGVSHRQLRSYAAFLVGLGWTCVVLGALVGLLPWFVLGWPPVPVEFTWAPWLLYAVPALGLLAGALGGLGCFIVSGVVRVLLDQRDLLEDLLERQPRPVRVGASPQPGSPSAPQDLFDLTGIKNGDEPRF